MMKTCPYCAEEIQSEAIKCRYCGEFLDGRTRPAQMSVMAMSPYFGYEYKSKVTLFGLPLIHVAQGINPETGAPRIAKGVFAFGNIAVGVFALGGVAMGGLTFGGVSVGAIAIGGMALGGIALGGVSFGLILAAGGIAVSLMYAIGGLALAPHAIGSLGADPEFVKMLEELGSYFGTGGQ